MMAQVPGHVRVAVVAGVAVCLFWGAPGAEGKLKFERNRTYVMTVMVQDGIVIPVTGVVTDKIEIGGTGSSRGRRDDDEDFEKGIRPVHDGEKRRSTKEERKALDEFFGKSDKERTSVEERSEPKPKSLRGRPRRSARLRGTIMLTGTIEFRDEAIVLVVEEEGEEAAAYVLIPDASKIEFFRKMAEERISALVLGQVTEEAQEPQVRVRSYITLRGEKRSDAGSPAGEGQEGATEGRQ